MRSQLTPLLAALTAAAVTASLALADDDHGDDRGGGDDRRAGAHEIGFWGDVPYSEIQRTDGVPNLISDMNRDRLAFSVHVGDIKSGGSRCDDPLYGQMKSFLNSLRDPALYTPGDNEWTDCDRPSAGAYSSRERLDYVRRQFFARPFSFGQRRVRVEQQSPPYVENTRWRRGGVEYAALHVVGSSNNLSDVAPDPAEWAGRDEATNRWLRETFRRAARTDATAVMLFAQANPGFDESDPTRAPVRDPRTLAAAEQPDGFVNFLRALREETVRFRRPVALVHGDSHYFRIDKPLLDEAGRRIENFTRVEIQGDNAQNGNNDVHWTKAIVDPRSDEVFQFQQQVVPGNRTAVPAP